MGERTGAVRSGSHRRRACISGSRRMIVAIRNYLAEFREPGSVHPLSQGTTALPVGLHDDMGKAFHLLGIFNRNALS